ncbi:MAG TPA: SusD/RagB family nutrient-binding outer membrane lipoprotein [Puia sp.]|jgi:hypothetical protein|nr:SusD/RagB family nutrient-binding outer membrane lipoprotein [Puia sp.]
MIIQNKLFKKILLCAIIAIVAVSCKKQLDTNLKNPNGVVITLLSGKDVFAQALASSVTDKIGANINPTPVDNYDYATQWMGYWARTTAFAASGVQGQMETFTLNHTFANGIWQSLYHNIYDYNFIIDHSSPNSILPGAAKVIRTMLFQDLVDQFGNIPYSEAAQPGVSITPKYDSATVIYKDLIVQLDSAIASINASQSTPDDAADVMFAGSKPLWLAFANTIKLRILLRQVPNVYQPNDPYITSELSNVSSNGGFLGAGQDALIQPGFTDLTSQTQSPFWGTYGFQPGSTSGYQGNNFFIANSLMVAFFDSTNDPRIGYFYAKNPNGSYGGNFFGNSVNTVVNISPIGTGILKSPSMPAILFSASQSLFMQAEAAQRGMITGDYAALFKQGVEESFRYLGVPDATTAADNFISSSTNAVVNIGSSTNVLKTILYQKWVAECELDGLEAYSDYRRTGFPVFTTPSFGAPGLPFPKRLLYPESEYTQNIANVNSQNQQTSDINTKIFWGL